jgi:hypothetical protein
MIPDSSFFGTDKKSLADARAPDFSGGRAIGAASVSLSAIA